MKKVTDQGGALRRRSRQAEYRRSSGARSACLARFCEVRGEHARGRRDHRRERSGGRARGVSGVRGMWRAWRWLVLKRCPDDALLEGVEMLARRSNEITAELLDYLIEVEQRGLHLREACWSLFAFCVERLHMS